MRFSDKQILSYCEAARSQNVTLVTATEHGADMIRNIVKQLYGAWPIFLKVEHCDKPILGYGGMGDEGTIIFDDLSSS